MHLLVIFGTAMLGFGCYMVAKPLQFSKGIARFSEKKWFHAFEIITRLAIGVVFLICADKTSDATLVSLLGGILCFVSLFLIVIGPSRHRRFALLTSGIGKNFRILGLFAIVGGLGLVYLGLE
ncbi:hypothetical protein [uncultured Paraglaciecola sp.]|uniref:hypothetical protein n=1 Tax=uncultured Paraglaciecola sp. TaxID=1765024 RepID=UPI0030D9647D